MASHGSAVVVLAFVVVAYQGQDIRALAWEQQGHETPANESLALFNEVLKAVHGPELGVIWDQVLFEVVPVLVSKPVLWEGVTLPPSSVFLSAQQHTVGELVALWLAVFHHRSSCLGVQNLDIPESTLWEYVIHLR